jgi:endonuclease/exonuclease/phosphatase family metal-dependent hydrolase
MDLGFEARHGTWASSLRQSEEWDEVRLVAALLLVLLTGCRTGRNYTSAEGPRFAGGPSEAPGAPGDTTTIKVVSFNVEFSTHIDSAIVLLSNDSALSSASVILLQEMNEQATRRVAEALGLWYVYYPAIYHFRTHQLFGNAVLSRWPIVDDRKIVLPHVSRFVRTQRTATAATIRVGSRQVRVYSTHLGTMGDISAGARRDQLRTILKDAARYPRVIIGGDMNDANVGRVARDLGYAWPTEHGPPTSRLGRLDHIFLKGFASPDSPGSGAVLAVGHISDHLPVWAVGILR